MSLCAVADGAGGFDMANCTREQLHELKMVVLFQALATSALTHIVCWDTSAPCLHRGERRGALQALMNGAVRM